MLQFILPVLVVMCSCNDTAEHSKTADKEGKETRSASMLPEIDTMPGNKQGEEMQELIQLDSDSIKNTEAGKKYILEKFAGMLEGMAAADIRDISRYTTKPIQNFGPGTVYKITFSEELPVVAPKTAYLLLDKDRNKGSLFFIDTILFLPVQQDKQACRMAGISYYKQTGFLTAYEFDGTESFKIIANTLHLCEDGIPVVNASIECLSYLSFALTMKTPDLDNDGYFDLQFSGTIAKYCDSLEFGYGRADRKPRKLFPLRFSLLYNPGPDGNGSYRLLQADSVCKYINGIRN